MAWRHGGEEHRVSAPPGVQPVAATGFIHPEPVNAPIRHPSQFASMAYTQVRYITWRRRRRVRLLAFSARWTRMPAERSCQFPRAPLRCRAHHRPSQRHVAQKAGKEKEKPHPVARERAEDRRPPGPAAWDIQSHRPTDERRRAPTGPLAQSALGAAPKRRISTRRSVTGNVPFFWTPTIGFATG